jgi:hypothetical protein
MGQYYCIINLDKKQFLCPRRLGDGLKLLEFAGGRTMTALAVLLANSNNRGGGDLRSNNPTVGSWAGDRVVIAGDYAESGDPGEPASGDTLYARCRDGEGDKPEFTDISNEVLLALCDDPYLRDEVRKELEPASRGQWSSMADAPSEVFAKVGLIKPFTKKP